MQNYGKKFGAGPYAQYGRANYLQNLPQDTPVVYASFAGGLDLREPREDTQPNTSPDCLDVYVTDGDLLRPVPGTTLLETLAYTPKQVFLQTSLDYTAELVFFAAPYLGVKSSGATQWYNVGLPVSTRPWSAVDFGGTLVFSNGRDAVYTREPNSTTITKLKNAPAGLTFATFAGRIFAGASVIDGNREPLGVSWSGASGDPDDWGLFDSSGAQTGAGYELLIDSMEAENEIIALKTMGLDFLAIFMRNSIWVGQRSGDPNRPADFQPRVLTVGAVNAACCIATRYGVLFLSDSGVYVFDGNSTNLLSAQINPALLPIDRTNLSKYSAAYNPLTDSYYLFAGTETWVFDLQKQRWHKRSLLAVGGTMFARIIPGLTYDQLVGTYDSNTVPIEDFGAKDAEATSFVLLDGAGRLGKEDPTILANFGTVMVPYWETPLQLVDERTLFTVQETHIAYEGDGILELALPDRHGYMVLAKTLSLSVGGRRTSVTYPRHTGKGIGCRLTYRYGQPSVRRIELRAQVRSSRIEAPAAPKFVQVASGAYYSDTFSGATVASLGAPWTSLKSGVIGINGGVAQNASGTVDSLYTLVGYPATASVALQAVVQSQSSFRQPGLAAGVVDANNFIRAVVSPGFNEIRVQRIAAGISTEIGYTNAFAVLSGTNYTLRFVVGPTQQKLYLNGTLVLTTSGAVAPGAFGITAFIPQAPSGAATWDNFTSSGGTSISVAGLPDGYTITLGATVATSASGTASLDLGTTVQPVVANLLVKNTVGGLVYTYTQPGGIWGGDSFLAAGF